MRDHKARPGIIWTFVEAVIWINLILFLGVYIHAATPKAQQHSLTQEELDRRTSAIMHCYQQPEGTC